MTDLHQIFLKIPFAKNICRYANSFPRLKAFYSNLVFDINAILREKKITLTTLYVPNSQATIFLNRKDERGLILFRKGQLAPHLITFWQSAINHLSPPVILDIGTNYGEFTISSNYPKNSTVICFEPNPDVAKLLKRSIFTHPSKDQIVLKQSAVGASSSEQLHLQVDEKWSGTSAITSTNGIDDGSLAVKSTSIDHVLSTLESSHDTNAPLVFKIDVEGYEPFVFEGMTSTLKSHPNFIGLVELNCSALLATGSDPETFLKHLKLIGCVSWIKRETILPLPDKEFDERILNNTFVADLIIASNKTLLETIISKNAECGYHWKRA